MVKGDRVATMMGNSTAYTAAWHGAAWAGAIDVPVNTELKSTFLEHVLRDAGASVMVLEGRFVERLQGLDLPDLRHVVLVDAPEFAEALAHDPVPPVPTGPHDVLYVIYTSGTTGPSKGVVHTNLSAMWYVQPHVEQLTMSERDVVYTNFPLFHQMGRSAMVTTAFWCGAAAALRPRFSIADFWDDVAHFGITVFAYLGTTLDLLLARPESPQDRATRCASRSAPAPARRPRRASRSGSASRCWRTTARPRRPPQARPASRTCATTRWAAGPATSPSRSTTSTTTPCRPGASARSWSAPRSRARSSRATGAGRRRRSTRSATSGSTAATPAT